MKILIIAEAGINHNGNLDTAKKLVDAAKESGADAVKFQTAWNISRLKKYEFTKKEWIGLKEYCDDVEILFLSTPHTFDAIHFLDDLVPMYKIASSYLHLPNFLMEVARKNKPILLSTGNLMHKNGMATFEAIRKALSYMQDSDITLLHCVSKYPCRLPYYNRIDQLKQFFNIPVGLSDHTKNIKLPRLPVIEKHIMLDGVSCVDENVSLTPDKFMEMVKWLRS